MTGAGIMLMSGDVPHGSLCTTDEVSALIERLQYDLGEGPCVDAYQLDRPVLEPDLAEPADAPMAGLRRARPRSGRSSGVRVPAPRRCRAVGRPQPLLRSSRARSATTSTPTRW